MKKIATFVLSSILIFGAAACDTARTSSDAPTSVDGNVDNAQNVEETKEDAQSQVRRDQLDADIRAREERNDMAGGEQADRTDSDLASEVRSKLEANIPRGQLVVEAEDGIVSIAGTVPDQKEYETIEPLAKEILGVKSVKTDVKVVPPAN
ncbi:MAG: BON domain-containing protein [Richelia sp. RM2_1_2]|nr:BON domain-containing protein [Richelia sp. SM2_1_7]NJM19182.1 BON domain-containing protein [Richelia sp. SM1_7_0]NJN06955.1 BON domain-containing protein [Richelia sp. RM1_1_1]NJO26229.1 BON domain-containing protein [Richelia sp. SL_2_1]NJO63543.1 BON domain-containing protein [Richelia sp. RM2_1_2]